MNRGLTLAATLAAVAALGGCGPSLGSYEVIAVSMVKGVPQGDEVHFPDTPLLRIDLRSGFDLIAETNGNIYAFKTECGDSGTRGHMIFGPYAAGDPPRDLLDAGQAMARNAEDKAAYVLFMFIEKPADMGHFSGDDIIPPYDLRKDRGDLCIKITQAGYYITESRSDTIRIPARDLAKALAKTP